MEQKDLFSGGFAKDTPKATTPAREAIATEVMEESHTGSVGLCDQGARPVGDKGIQRSGESPDKKKERPRATRPELKKLVERQSYQCATCRIALTPDMAELDHKQPRADGGDDSIENLQWLCRDCNRAKGTLTQHEFLRLCRRVASNHLHGGVLPGRG